MTRVRIPQLKPRRYSVAFCGAAFGDEGKGRIVDKYVSDLAKKRSVIVYRDNGGANAGHTVEFENGQRVALHQIPSGIFHPRATVVLGKGMVVHPADLLEELLQVKKAAGAQQTATVLIDREATLSLDTHRAFEGILKNWQEGGKGSTGRGIAPAYVDILLRHPVRVKDLQPFNKKKIEAHYSLYEALLKGLGQKLADVSVLRLSGETIRVGSQHDFIQRLLADSKKLSEYIADVHPFLTKSWNDSHFAFVFEKAQAVGLDVRYGVYPDVTASDTTIDGIFSSTEGIIDPDRIEQRIGVIKATYMSSVGTRRLPTLMPEKLAHRIREDAHEYGSTTKRPRDIAYLDLPMLTYFARVGRCNGLALTHMDIVYPETPIKVCVGYKRNGKEVLYRPDQEFLDTVKPVYMQLPPWNREALTKATTQEKLPQQAKKFLRFIEKTFGLPVVMITTGPKREQGIVF